MIPPLNRDSNFLKTQFYLANRREMGDIIFFYNLNHGSVSTCQQLYRGRSQDLKAMPNIAWLLFIYVCFNILILVQAVWGMLWTWKFPFIMGALNFSLAARSAVKHKSTELHFWTNPLIYMPFRSFRHLPVLLLGKLTGFSELTAIKCLSLLSPIFMTAHLTF